MVACGRNYHVCRTLDWHGAKRSRSLHLLRHRRGLSLLQIIHRRAVRRKVFLTGSGAAELRCRRFDLFLARAEHAADAGRFCFVREPCLADQFSRRGHAHARRLCKTGGILRQYRIGGACRRFAAGAAAGTARASHRHRSWQSELSDVPCSLVRRLCRLSASVFHNSAWMGARARVCSGHCGLGRGARLAERPFRRTASMASSAMRKGRAKTPTRRRSVWNKGSRHPAMAARDALRNAEG